MSDAEGAEGALELAFWVSAIIVGTRAEEAQSVGVDDFGDAMGLERLAEVQEVTPGRVRGDEAPGHVEAGVVVDGEKKGLLARAGPPLVNGTVVLPKFADTGAAEASIDSNLFRRGGNEVREMDFDVGFDA